MSDLPIFKTFAPKYWAAGYSVIPLDPGTKKPAISRWTGYCNNLPNQLTQSKWLETYGANGIGLLLGTEVQPAFRILAVDIDRDALADPVSALFEARSGKRGKKGVTLFVRVPVSEKIKSSKIPGPDADAGDLLGSGRMTVLPPSIHPDTGEPYEFTGAELLETPFDELPLFDRRLSAVLSRLCASTSWEAIQAGQGTHDATLKLSAQLVASGATDEEIFRVVKALLPPDYAGNTIEELPEMIRSAREKGFAKSEDEKGRSIEVVDACEREGLELFHWRDTAYLSVPTESGGCISYAVRARAAELFIRNVWFESTGEALTQGVLNEVVATFETLALFASPASQIWNRVGPLNGDVYVDLGRKDGRLVRITKTGWELCYDKRVKFRRTSNQLELPEPESGGSLVALQELLHLSPQNYLAIIGFLIGALRPEGPYFALLVEGEQGSGKSFLASIVKALIDPNEADRLRLPESERDLGIQAREYRLLSYDNSSGMKAEMSDALCVVATGGGLATRKLYTDAELEVFTAARPVVVNGISGFAKRPDLLERAIYVHLEKPEKRMTEKELREKFAQATPKILGALYDAIAHALAHLDDTPAPDNIRMSDAAQWVPAAEDCLGVPPCTVISAIAQSQDALVIERINDDPLTIAFRHITQLAPYRGLCGSLCLRGFARAISPTFQGLRPRYRAPS